MDLGAKLKSLRLRAKFTQQQLADRLGVDRSAIAHIEGGKATTTTMLLAWIEACGGSLEVHGSSAMEPPAQLDVQALTLPQQAALQVLVDQLRQGNVKPGV